MAATLEVYKQLYRQTRSVWKRQLLKIAWELKYDNYILRKIANAATPEEAERALTTARERSKD